ncbi:glycosyltransferase [Flavobacterium sp.]|uniref:glycosyltransferase n=1 Tax=Flavobacterium sp. TaxID=239 RepID=UPI0028BEB873|nr:glycosyltransferase [Flavobacterium sp.]
MNYFKERRISLDFVAERSETMNDDAVHIMKEKGLIQNGFLLDRLSIKKNRFKYLLLHSIPRKFLGGVRDFDRTKYKQKEAFRKICESNEYDYIIISYACWAPLLDCLPKKSKTKYIIDTHDFLTSQFKNSKRFRLGKYFEEEIRMLNKFDRVWVISNDEKYLFSQFLSKEIDLIPHSLPNNSSLNVQEKSTDILYVASDNIHNKKSADWFFSNVYPLLEKDYSITVVGSINNHIPDFDNITKVTYAEDLTKIYSESRITVCPMLSGTGLKIKVVESLSFGLPVVCTEKGVDGLPNKTNNGCLIADDVSVFASYVSKLLEDNQFYQEQAGEAKSFFNAFFDIETSYKKLDTIFKYKDK